ncbi:MAG TPA: NADH-quinone oxidoreductase subunit N, partial [Hyphomicrobiaceae bacterium]|nr:NADH-quinone oxidoreductase subunit N [Hyphomicrobiaceae bacterium]
MTSDLQSFAALAPAWPELLLAVGAVVLLLGGVIWSRERSSALALISIVLLVAVTALMIWQPAEGTLFNGGFIVDGFARYMKFLVVGGSAFTLILSTSAARPFGLDKFEYAILVLLATLGMMVMVSANDLMSLYVGLELQSLALYVVAALKRDDTRATEAGLKYFVLGALSSGLLLYGASLVYGFTGLTQLDQIVGAITAGSRSIGLVFGLVFLLAGIAFKISAVSFHMWTPDVYEGAPTPVTAFFAAAPKVA